MQRIIASFPESMDINDLHLKGCGSFDITLMAGTIAFNQRVIVDIYFPEKIAGDLTPLVILGAWDLDVDKMQLLELIPLDPAFLQYLPDEIVFDSDGNIVSITPPVLHIPVLWFGWAV